METGNVTLTLVNAEVRAKAKAAIKDKGMTQKDVADALGVDRVYVNRMLSGNASQIPSRWADLLNLLGLKIVAVEDEKGQS